MIWHVQWTMWGRHTMLLQSRQSKVSCNGSVINNWSASKQGIIYKISWCNIRSALRFLNPFVSSEESRECSYQATLITLYYTCMYPYLTYCIVIWGKAYKVQKKAVEMMLWSNYNSNAPPLVNPPHLGTLPMRKLYLYNILLFMYKIMNNMYLVFDMLSNNFVDNSSLHFYATGQNQKLHVPSCF